MEADRRVVGSMVAWETQQKGSPTNTRDSENLIQSNENNTSQMSYEDNAKISHVCLFTYTN